MEEHGKHRPLVRLWLAVAALCLAPLPAAACRLALLLALDVSSSVDPAEDALQRQGLARALRSEAVREAMFALPAEPVALAAFEWSGRDQQAMLLTWRMIATPADLEAAAAVIGDSRRRYTQFPTALGYAMGHAARVMERAPACLFHTIDVSGDGVNNDGFPPRLAYANFPYDGVLVNGLAIAGHDAGVETYYAEQVIRGPGAFVERADGFEDFERAMRRKLVRELGVRIVGEAR
ncbi:Protein of unknown function [Tranquillimonas rosea]|uniref:DUF1194 domain-containing protein n=1 Tax=Tranquillimonas rosea TaxID=641238 RepID=A0A1H9WCG8_9RHOB|nr:DUF1194 domain-containing protein [Tranquillimonas rosea]SES31479.1 Protein of unknown function [Tranquillimonas rosea]